MSYKKLRSVLGWSCLVMVAASDTGSVVLAQPLPAGTGSSTESGAETEPPDGGVSDQGFAITAETPEEAENARCLVTVGVLGGLYRSLHAVVVDELTRGPVLNDHATGSSGLTLLTVECRYVYGVGPTCRLTELPEWVPVGAGQWSQDDAAETIHALLALAPLYPEAITLSADSVGYGVVNHKQILAVTERARLEDEGDEEQACLRERMRSPVPHRCRVRE